MNRNHLLPHTSGAPHAPSSEPSGSASQHGVPKCALKLEYENATREFCVLHAQFLVGLCDIRGALYQPVCDTIANAADHATYAMLGDHLVYTLKSASDGAPTAVAVYTPTAVHVLALDRERKLLREIRSLGFKRHWAATARPLVHLEISRDEQETSSVLNTLLDRYVRHPKRLAPSSLL